MKNFWLFTFENFGAIIRLKWRYRLSDAVENGAREQSLNSYFQTDMSNISKDFINHITYEIERWRLLVNINS